MKDKSQFLLENIYKTMLENQSFSSTPQKPDNLFLGGRVGAEVIHLTIKQAKQLFGQPYEFFSGYEVPADRPQPSGVVRREAKIKWFVPVGTVQKGENIDDAWVGKPLMALIENEKGDLKPQEVLENEDFERQFNVTAFRWQREQVKNIINDMIQQKFPEKFAIDPTLELDPL